MDINKILNIYEKIELNIGKLTLVWNKIKEIIPSGAAFFVNNIEYNELCNQFQDILNELPSIDGYSIQYKIMDLNDIGSQRLSYNEFGDIYDKVALEEEIYCQEKYIFEYKYLLIKKRKELLRERINLITENVDSIILNLLKEYPFSYDPKNKRIPQNQLNPLTEEISNLNLLLGNMKRPTRWSYLSRHLSFGLVQYWTRDFRHYF